MSGGDVLAAVDLLVATVERAVDLLDGHVEGLAVPGLTVSDRDVDELDHELGLVRLGVEGLRARVDRLNEAANEAAVVRDELAARGHDLPPLGLPGRRCARCGAEIPEDATDWHYVAEAGIAERPGEVYDPMEPRGQLLCADCNS